MNLRGKIRDKYEAAKKLKQDMEDGLSDKVVDGAAMTLRSDVRFLNRWKEYCGVDRWDDIDYSNPCVYIEWCACDISILNLCDDAEAFVEATRCDRETFLRYYWPKGHGEPQFDDADTRARAYRKAANPVNIVKGLRSSHKNARANNKE